MSSVNFYQLPHIYDNVCKTMTSVLRRATVFTRVEMLAELAVSIEQLTEMKGSMVDRAECDRLSKAVASVLFYELRHYRLSQTAAARTELTAKLEPILAAFLASSSGVPDGVRMATQRACQSLKRVRVALVEPASVQVDRACCSGYTPESSCLVSKTPGASTSKCTAPPAATSADFETPVSFLSASSSTEIPCLSKQTPLQTASSVARGPLFDITEDSFFEQSDVSMASPGGQRPDHQDQVAEADTQLPVETFFGGFDESGEQEVEEDRAEDDRVDEDRAVEGGEAVATAPAQGDFFI
jgi:hypothetical protein